MRIVVISPGITESFNKSIQNHYDRIRDEDTTVEVVNCKKGPEVIETARDEAFSTPFAIEEVLKAEKGGADGVIIFCCCLPTEAFKEVASIPVIGIGEAAILFSALLGDKFSILAPTRSLKPLFRRNAQRLGLGHKLASVRSLEIPIQHLNDLPRLQEAALREGAKAVDDDDADALMFGCGLMFGVEKAVEEVVGVPVVECASPALSIIKGFVNLGLRQSKRTYHAPPDTKIIF